MGYTTDFFGRFNVTPALEEEHRIYLLAFNMTRRMKRSSLIAEELDDPVRKKVGLPTGIEGEYFVGGSGFIGQDNDASVLDRNYPPRTQPGLWCKWEPSENGQYIEWDRGEKFYDYTNWLHYIINNFLERWGYILNGEVEWQGEDKDDMGKIVVVDNVINIKRARIVYE